MSRAPALALALLVGCGADPVVVVPVIDSPTDSDAAVLADLTRIEVVVEHANGDPIATQSFDRGEPVEIAGIPFGDDLVIEINGFAGESPDPIAIGRTCSFALSPDQEPPSPHLFLSRIGKVATIGFATEVRANGFALSEDDGDAVMLGGDNSMSIERFDPRTGEFAETELALEPRTQAAIAELGTVARKPVVIGGIVDGAGLADSIEVIDVEAARIDRTIDDNLTLAHTGVVATELTDGRILVTGGRDPGMLTPSGKAAPVGSIATLQTRSDGAIVIEQQAETLHPRAGHTATRLADDAGAPVLVIGGVDDQDLLVPEAELYKPLNDDVLDTFKPMMITPRRNHRAVRLGDGSVLVIGGVDAAGNPVRSLERFSLIEGFTEVTNDTLPIAAGVVDFSVTPLPDGRILLAGGRIPPDPDPVRGVYFVTFNPDADVVTIDAAGDEMSVGRANHQAVLMCDGTVLITGGTDSPSVAERFNANVIQR